MLHRRYVVLFLLLAGSGVLAAEDTLDLAEKLAKVPVEKYAPAKGYSEGPIWRNGELYFCCDALIRVPRSGVSRKYLNVNPGANFLSGDGHLFICANKAEGTNQFAALLDLAPDGTVGVIVEKYQGENLGGLNDLTVDRAGNIYWTDPFGSTREQPNGKIFRVRPDGRVDLLASNLAYPNGLDVDPSNHYLYVVESQTAKILRYDLPADDQPLGEATVFYALGGAGGDGCTFDASGNLWVADWQRPDTKKGRITVLDPAAKVLGYVKIPAGQVSNICFGGPQFNEIFVTTGEPGGVFHAKVGVPGFRGHPGKKMKIVRKLQLKPIDEPAPLK